MPGWLTGRLAGPIFGAVVIVLAGFLIAASFKIHFQAEALDDANNRIVDVKADNRTLSANNSKLEAAIASQNVSIANMKAEGERIRAAGLAAMAAAEREASAIRGQRGAIADARAGSDKCASASELIRMTVGGSSKVMRAIIILPILLLCLTAGSCDRSPPEPEIRTVEVQVPVAVPCKPSVPSRPDYADNYAGQAADIFEQVRLLLIGRNERQEREVILEGAITGCGGKIGS